MSTDKNNGFLFSGKTIFLSAFESESSLTLVIVPSPNCNVMVAFGIDFLLNTNLTLSFKILYSK